MKIEKYLQKRIGIFCVTLLGITLLTISSSYAFSDSSYNDEAVDSSVKNLVINFEDNNSIVKTTGYPMTLEDGKNNSPVNKVCIKNNGIKDNKYELYINHRYNTDDINISKVYYSINESEPKVLGYVDKGLVYKGSVNREEETCLDIKLWIGLGLVDNTDQGKELVLNFNVK